MSRVQLIGLPFTALRGEDNGLSLLPGAIPAQAEVSRHSGVDTLIIGGTTDEYVSLSISERESIAREWRREVPKGARPRLVLHTGSDSLVDAQRLGALAAELEYDAVLISAPGKFKAPSLAAHVECVATALAKCEGLPVFYYHFAQVHGDDFPLVPLKQALQARCPNIIGFKLSGVPAEPASDFCTSDENFGVMITGHVQLRKIVDASTGRKPATSWTGSLSWVTQLWEAPRARAYLDAHATQGGGGGEAGARYDELSEMRTSVLGARVVAERCNYQMSAEKAFMRAWSGVDVGPCRPPLPTLPPDEVAPVVEKLYARGLLDPPFERRDKRARTDRK